jgi:hypothetical protein
MEESRTHLPPREAFAAAVSSGFDVRSGDEAPVQFTLLECNTLVDTNVQECYTLLFRGPADLPPVQGIYALENDQLGRIKLFLVPIRKDAQGIYFEAVMNHLLSH